MSATGNTEVTHTTMTEEEYVAAGGVRCPKCGSQNLSGDSFDTWAGGASQSIGCNDCDAEWTDMYKLVGYGEIMTPE